MSGNRDFPKTAEEALARGYKPIPDLDRHIRQKLGITQEDFELRRDEFSLPVLHLLLDAIERTREARRVLRWTLLVSDEDQVPNDSSPKAGPHALLSARRDIVHDRQHRGFLTKHDDQVDDCDRHRDLDCGRQRRIPLHELKGQAREVHGRAHGDERDEQSDRRGAEHPAGGLGDGPGFQKRLGVGDFLRRRTARGLPDVVVGLLLFTSVTRRSGR